MKFKLYDILSQLVPGFLIYLSILHILDRPFDNKLIVPATVIAYIIGYFVNTISSWLEDLYNLTWGGKPSDQLLEGKDIWKVRFYHSGEVRQLLIKDSGKEDPTKDELFGIAMRYSSNSENIRVQDFKVIMLLHG